MIKSLMVFLKGLFVGGTMMVPGVSGGSMAMILGIYDRLISSIASFRKSPLKNTLYLLKFGIGSIIGIALFSRFIIAPLFEAYKIPVSYFFLGAVAGGIPMIYKTAGVKRLNLNAVIYPVIGIILVLLITLIPSGLFTPEDSVSLLGIVLQLLGGVIIAAALILPGISVSQMLLMLGLYEAVLAALSDISALPAFIPLGIGLLVGCVVCAKLMDSAMQRHPQPTYLTVFGFLLGSLTELFPGLPVGIDIPICIATFTAGFCFIFFLQRLESKKVK